jgi:hypothetical protein
MIDWVKVLRIGIDGAPAAAFTLFLVFAVWFIRRLLQGVARLIRKDRQTAQDRPKASTGPVRIEPVLGSGIPLESSATEGADPEHLKKSIELLTRRVEALETRLVSSPRGPGSALRVVKIDEAPPVELA